MEMTEASKKMTDVLESDIQALFSICLFKLTIDQLISENIFSFLCFILFMIQFLYNFMNRNIQCIIRPIETSPSKNKFIYLQLLGLEE